MESMNSILDTIIQKKKIEVEHSRTSTPQSMLEEYLANSPLPLNFSGALLGGDVRLIAEVKKSSPSKGILRPSFNAVELACSYAENGAAAISVLTDMHFEGNLTHLSDIKNSLDSASIPILRKDFIIDPYQIYEAKAFGADAILLIVGVLERQMLSEFLAIAKTLWVQCLVEIHSEQELQIALDCGAEIIGINNRNLNTFKTNIDVTRELTPKIPKGKVIVSESGINTRETILELGHIGVHAVLIGEGLVTSIDVGKQVREFSGFSGLRGHC
ncbi:indole-3-glycerol phosphate synthase TrpC [SAR202 cluster bacterium AD-802-E10_MRT_200m]|nr:indole-3-glycerol phosphate synthase TrpC [SAR202 cluster bacterium AD-802-E10_MRT_200m]